MWFSGKPRNGHTSKFIISNPLKKYSTQVTCFIALVTFYQTCRNLAICCCAHMLEVDIYIERYLPTCRSKSQRLAGLNWRINVDRGSERMWKQAAVRYTSIKAPFYKFILDGYAWPVWEQRSYRATSRMRSRSPKPYSSRVGTCCGMIQIYTFWNYSNYRRCQHRNVNISLSRTQSLLTIHAVSNIPTSSSQRLHRDAYQGLPFGDSCVLSSQSHLSELILGSLPLRCNLVLNSEGWHFHLRPSNFLSRPWMASLATDCSSRDMCRPSR